MYVRPRLDELTPDDLLVLQYGHLVPPASVGNRVETLDALLLAATELSDGEGALVAQLVLEAHGASEQRNRPSAHTRRRSRGGEDPCESPRSHDVGS